MTYLDLINDFWREFERNGGMRPNDVMLYFYLLRVCSDKRWENPFELSNKKIRLCLEMTDKSIIESRNRLAQRGLIEVTAGKRRKAVPTYRLLRFCFPTESKTESKTGFCFPTESKTESKNGTKKEKKAKKNAPQRAENQTVAKKENFPSNTNIINNNNNNNNNINNNILLLKSDAKNAGAGAREGEGAREEGLLEIFFREERRGVIEALCMNLSTDEATLRRLADEVLLDWQLTDQKHNDLNDAQRHLLSQMRIKLNIERRQQKNAPKGPRRVNDEWADFPMPE